MSVKAPLRSSLRSASVFESEAVSRRPQRLLNYRFDVAAFVRTQRARPTSWWQDEG